MLNKVVNLHHIRTITKQNDKMKTPTQLQKTQSLVSGPRKTFQEFQADNKTKVFQWMKEDENEEETEYIQEDERCNFQRTSIN